MKKIENICALFLVVTILFSCTADVTEKVQLNGQEFPSSLVAPEDENDLLTVMADAEKFRIVAIDKSSPSGDVSSRVWVLRNQYEDVVRTVTDSSTIRLLLPNAGLFSLNLTVNDDVEGSITNWIMVEGEVEGIVSNSLVDFVSPSRAFEVSNERNYSVLLKASIWEEDLENLAISHNGKAIKPSNYEFDESNEQILFSVKLKEGENTVQVIGDIEGEAIDVTRTIEYIKDDKKSSSSQLAQNSGGASGGSSGGQSNRSVEEDEQVRPEQPLSSQVQQEEEEDEPEPVVEVVKPKADPVEEPKKPEPKAPVVEEEEEEDLNAPTQSFDHGNSIKPLSAYSQSKTLGIKVSKLSELTGGCAIQFGKESFVIDITNVKQIMYFESLQLAQNPEFEGTDVTIKLECLNTDFTKLSRSEDAVVGYTENKPMKITLQRLKKMALLPGNKYRLTITPADNVELAYVTAATCTEKIDTNDIVKLSYKDGKCPLFSLKLKH